MPTPVRISWGDGNTSYGDLDAAEAHQYARPNPPRLAGDNSSGYRIKAQTLDGSEHGSTVLCVTSLDPHIDSIAPTSIAKGPPANTDIVITGSNFADDARVRLNDVWFDTTHNADGTLTITIKAGTHYQAGTWPVQVGNHPPEGSDSNKVDLTVT